MAETVRFELTDGCPSAVFKTAGLNHSPKSPQKARILAHGDGVFAGFRNVSAAIRPTEGGRPIHAAHGGQAVHRMASPDGRDVVSSW